MNSPDHLAELESLRSQVADLARALAERDRSMQDLREQSQLLRTIVEGTAAETGDEFFASLVTHLTSTLHVQYAVIGEVLEGPLRKIRTLAVSAGGTLADNFEYELAHTPCATALTQAFVCFDRDVQATFPHFQRLADLGAESYCAVPLRTKGGAVIGLLVVMDTKPLQQGDYLQTLLGVFAPRIAVEIERRRAEQERAQALVDLHNVMETVPDVMFTLDTQGSLVRWNRRLGEVTGYSPEELMNKPALALMPPEEQTRTAAAIQRAFTEGYAELDGQLLTKDLRTIPYHWTGALLKTPHGEPIGITGIGRDLSDKKRAEEDLRHQRRHLVEAQALAHLGSWDWDIDNDDVRWSDEQFRISGHEPGAIAVTYDTFLTSLLPDDHDPVLAAFNDALLGKRPYNVEYRIVRPNGEVRFIHARGDVHRDATGHPLSMAGTVLDITDRKQTEEALRASEERWELTVRGNNDGILDWNIRTGDVFFSSRWKAMRGFEGHEIRNHVDEWRSRIHPNDLDRVLQSIDAYLVKQTSEFCEEYRVQRKDGSYMWILNRGMALWADDGTPLRMVVSESDIAERKRAEQEQHRLIEDLTRSQQHFQTLFKWTPSAVGISTVAEGRFCDVNEGFSRLTGYAREEVIGRTTLELGLWAEPSERAAMVRDIQKQGYLHNREGLLRTKSGEIRSLIVSVDSIQLGSTPCLIYLGHDITERKRAEAALMHSRNLLQSVIHTAPIRVFWKDRESRYLGCNQLFAKDAGETAPEHVIGKSDVDLAWGKQAELYRADDRQVMESGLPKFDFEEPQTAPDGKLIWLRTSKVPLCDETNQVVGVLGVSEDITERKRAEEALRESEERLQQALEASGVGTWRVDLRTGLDTRDAGLNRLLGLPPETTTQPVDNWFTFVHQDDRPVMDAAWHGASVTDLYEVEHRLIRRDGTSRWVYDRGRFVRDEAGQLLYATGAVLDITERKRAEAALRLTQFAVDRGADMAFWIDRSARISYVNDAACQRLGYSREELLAMTIPDLDPDYQMNPWPQHWNELKEQKRLRFETRHRTKSGDIYPVETVANYVAFEGQEYNFAFCRDITDRKQAEEVLHQRERDLRAAIEERKRISQDLHDGILQSLFAVGLTLEVSKSMMSIRARKTSGASLDQAIDQLNRVMREIRNFIAGLGSDLLQGKDLETALQHMLASLTQNQATRVRLAVEDRAAKSISAEQSLHLLLVIQEAVSNCIQHGRAQEARVSLKMMKQGVRLSIRDNGRGFNPDAAHGTGQGLGNMAARAQKLGGRFTVLSKVNEGTRIVLDLPKEAADVRR